MIDTAAILRNLPYQGCAQEQERCATLLYRHSRDVADLALEIAQRHPELELDLGFLEEAAMLHDVGIVLTSAPSIHCHGQEPYIRHGELGQQILNNLNLPRHGQIAARHTGSGLTKDEIVSQGLPLTPTDYLPLTIEEKLVCYADKFFSKSNPEHRKSTEQARHSLQKFGAPTLERFDRLVELFGEA